MKLLSLLNLNLLLSLECAILGYWMSQTPSTRMTLRRCLTTLYASLSISALLGAIVHSDFFVSESSIFSSIWKMCLIALTFSSYMAWLISAQLLQGFWKFLFMMIGSITFIIYTTIIIFVNQEFWIAILNYLLPTLLLILFTGYHSYLRRDVMMLLAPLGLCLMLLGSYFQTKQQWILWGVLNNNAIFHILFGIGFLIAFFGFRQLLKHSIQRSNKIA